MLNFASLSAAASALAHSRALQANPPLPDPIGPVVHPGDKVSLNPQPLPPREMSFGALSHRFEGVALNPQPLPPRDTVFGAWSNRFEGVALNPQPLPPREALLGGHRGSIAAIRATLDPAQLQAAHGIHKALIGALFPPAPHPLGHRGTVSVFSDAILDTPPAR